MMIASDGAWRTYDLFQSVLVGKVVSVDMCNSGCEWKITMAEYTC